MKHLKMFVGMGLVVCFLLTGTKEVLAITHIGSCGATLKKVTCGIFVGNAAGSHVVYTTSNGTKVWCSTTAEKHNHVVSCANCGAVYSPASTRTCMVRHTYCPAETGVCQY